MRRHEREITDPAILAGILGRTQTMHIAFICENGPAIVPMTFGYEISGGEFIFYLHGAKEGRKIEAWRADPRVAFDITGIDEIHCAVPPCASTTKYAGIIGAGKIETLDGDDEKCHALDMIMKHCGSPGPHEYPAGMLAATAVFRIKAETVRGKSNITGFSGI